MPEYLSPGVYVEEIDAGPKPIAPVATSTAGAVGVTQRGPKTPTLITNYGEFVRTFGGPLPLPDASIRTAWADRGNYWGTAESIKAFFDEGGARMYVQRVVPSVAIASSVQLNGGLYAGLMQDVKPGEDKIQLTHVFGIKPGSDIALVTEDGVAIKTVKAKSVNYADRTVTLTAAAGVTARRGRDLARLVAVKDTLKVVKATAASAGAWGDDISVQILPTVGTRKTLGAPSTNGSAVITVDGADRLYPDAVVQLEGAAGAEVLMVVSIAGSLVTLSGTPANQYLKGDSVAILEAEVSVRYRPVGGNEETERFAGLRLTKAADPASLIAGVNLRSRLIRLTAGADFGTALQAFPAVATGAWAALGTTDKGDDALGKLATSDFIGVDLGPGQRTGIQALEEIDQVAICIVPGMWDVDIRNALIIHCDTLGDRFAILDPPPGLSVQDIEKFRLPIDTKYAALYYPWVEIRDPRPGGDVEQAPPSGFMAGIYARTDVARGVHKAPANEVIRSIRGLAQTITKREQDILNPQNINVLRAFPGRGNRVWGARVLTSDSAWKYVPVRRLFLMIEESIDEGTQFVVFEPNDESTWARVRQTITNFLTTQWRLGALQGVTADEAFFVTCDRSTMTQDDIDNGRLICQIGIAPVKPAEFVIFRIQQKSLEITN